MSEKSRRQMLREVAASLVLAGTVDAAVGQEIHRLAGTPKLFNPHEFATLGLLTDLILPGARAAGAAAWIDMLAAENAELMHTYTRGLGRLDILIQERGEKDFLSASPARQMALLDLIAYRKNDSPELASDIVFFDWARRMTIDAFYTSEVGIKELDYRGNTALGKYEVPAEAIKFVLKN